MPMWAWEMWAVGWAMYAVTGCLLYLHLYTTPPIAKPQRKLLREQPLDPVTGSWEKSDVIAAAILKGEPHVSVATTVHYSGFPYH